ncbi:helix-turn-helix domain-containing protein (plasmid) [Nicoliella spurrieriana]|uniref:Helix-turn-helix domain-containing protein n=1 Tax=Nicoliella spurrieriana TaxID=2925830 RepID=A0A976X4W3_9LACO|nr:helix-turn-helix transcriptional regulator [Nicoliella spurrieriana]UQS86174.1 helix-turn-helix domain-containing protein [Nicoliella spurrieriana]
MEFGEKLKQLRKDNGYGVNQLAIQSGVSASQISRIENNKRKPKIDTLRKLAKGLRIPEGDMFKLAGISNDEQLNDKLSFDIEEALDNDDYMTYGGRPLTDDEKKLLTKILRDD